MSRWCLGSPAHKYGLRATLWILEVNDVPTPTLTAFKQVVSQLPTGSCVRIRTRDLNTKPKVFTLKTDEFYWPFNEYTRVGSEWTSVV